MSILRKYGRMGLKCSLLDSPGCNGQNALFGISVERLVCESDGLVLGFMLDGFPPS